MKPQAAHCAAALVAAVVLAAGPAQAQEARWRPFVSVTPVYEGDADLDQGGDFNVWRVGVRATRSLGDQMSLHLYAGVVAAGRLRVEDPSGNLLREDDFDPAPFFGATFVGRF